MSILFPCTMCFRSSFVALLCGLWLFVLLARGLSRRHAADAERGPEGHERQRSLPTQHGRNPAVQVRRDARLDAVLDVVAEAGDVALSRVALFVQVVEVLQIGRASCRERVCQYV